MCLVSFLCSQQFLVIDKQPVYPLKLSLIKDN
ncbi:hypothetical protein DEU44_2814 [Priestia megaterium]|nr:hypothetical protein DEU44_2814 [Priestia megaterium]